MSDRDNHSGPGGPCIQVGSNIHTFIRSLTKAHCKLVNNMNVDSKVNSEGHGSQATTMPWSSFGTV